MTNLTQDSATSKTTKKSIPVKVSIPADLYPLIAALAEQDRVSIPKKVVQLMDKALEAYEEIAYLRTTQVSLNEEWDSLADNQAYNGL